MSSADANSQPVPGEPIAGFSMSVYVDDRSSGFTGIQKARVITDARGAFSASFEDSPTRPLEVRFMAPGDDEFDVLLQSAALEQGQRTLDVEVLRPRRASLEGRTVDPNGTPLPGVRLVFRSLFDNLSDLTTVSDDAGRFRIAAFTELLAVPTGRLEAEYPGYSLARSTVTRLGPDGWLPMEVVLAPHGTLVVRLLTLDEKPLSDMRVEVHAAPFEQSGRVGSVGFASLPGGTALGKELTDATGTVRFLELPAGLRLAVELHLPGGMVERTRMYGDELIFDGAAGEPIVLEAGRDLELTTRVYEGGVSGRVVYPSGDPVRRPGIRMESTSRVAGKPDFSIDGLGAEDGTFFVPLLRERLTAVRLLATDGELPEREKQCGFAWAATATLSLQDLSRGEPVTLTVEPALSISGSVVDPEGKALVSGTLWAVPTGSPFPEEPVSFGFVASTRFQGGDFRVCGLSEGGYDLWVSFWDDQQHFQHRQRFEGFPAGARDARLVLDGARPVEVRILTDLEAASADALYLLVVRDWPRSGERGVARPTREIHVRRPSWPIGHRVGYTGGGNETDEHGVRQFTGSKTTGIAEIELSMTEGWYTFGVLAVHGYERPFAPISTGRIWLGAGQHTIVFHPPRTAELTGTVHPARAGLAVQLVDEEGPIPLPNAYSNDVDRFVRTDTQGRFAFDPPVGEYTLRVGRDEDLLRGVFELEVPVSIHAGENAPLALVLR